MTSELGNVLPTRVQDVGMDVGGADEPWWLAAPALLREILQRDFVSRATASYRLGDVVLEMDADHPSLLAAFPGLYGDCAVTGPRPPGVTVVRCTMRRSVEPPLMALTFDEGAPADPAAVAYNLLRPTQAVAPFRVWDAPLPGWRFAGGVTGPVLAACGEHVLLHLKLIPPAFVVEYLVGTALGVQPGVLSIHGGSVQIGDAGAVLVGASHSSKTTTSLHLAARGHALLGDEVALIRLATAELIPFRRTVNVRPGPRAEALASVLRRGEAGAAAGIAADEKRHRISELFPDRSARPVPLRAVFFLAGFADRPSLDPFQLTLDQSEVIGWITTPEIAYCSWGLSPARRAFRLMVLKELLSRIPCWLLKVGSPEDTVELIERTMEELAC